jgi:hypothetical protein
MLMKHKKHSLPHGLIPVVASSLLALTASAAGRKQSDGTQITSVQITEANQTQIRWTGGLAPFVVQASSKAGNKAVWIDVLTTYQRKAIFSGHEDRRFFRVKSSTGTSPKPPSAFTTALNAAVKGELPFSDTQDYEDAIRGLIAKPAVDVITNANGEVIHDFHQYDFLQGEAPPSVNPSLWRQAQLNSHYGLFQVVDGIYQIRGFDLANITLVAGDTG